MNISQFNNGLCVLCANCKNVCKNDCINFEMEKIGCRNPSVDLSKCINCGLCVSSCQINKKPLLNNNRTCYSFVSNNKNVIEHSSSGGAFYEIASKFIGDGGIVYGCAMLDCNVKHIRVTAIDDLHKLQGSKYVQSSLNNIFDYVEKDLKNKQNVLFSGTPCQIFALKLFLRKEYDSLFTIDLVCHGVPSNELFLSYVKEQEKKYGKSVSRIEFRKKNSARIYKRCRFNETITFNDGMKVIRPYYKSSYYYFFLKKSIYRESCYRCQFATKERIGDITLGDFWGIVRKNKINEKDYGCSLVLVNSEKGETLSEYIKDDLRKEDVDIAVKNNQQLCEPSKKSKDRILIAELYASGYSNIEHYFKVHYKKERFIASLKRNIPRFIKNRLQ